MTIFLDTANLEDVKKYMAWGIVRGITTNQKLFSQEGKISFEERIRELLSLDVPISIELTKTNGTDDQLIEEALDYVKMDGNTALPDDSNIVIKVPMWGDGRGLRVARFLVAEGVKVNMTCMMSLNQGILACELGVTYASLFFNRMNDWASTSSYASETISRLRDIIEEQQHSTQIIAGSIRKPSDVYECFYAGAHIVTIPPKILEQMPYHPKTEETIAEFDEAWRQFQALK